MIAVFTKYDQFRRNIRIKLEDQRRDPAFLDAEVDRTFDEQYLANLMGPPPFICLESENFNNQRACAILISRLKECTNLTNGVMALLKSLPVHSLVTSLR